MVMLTSRSHDRIALSTEWDCLLGRALQFVCLTHVEVWVKEVGASLRLGPLASQWAALYA